MEKGKNIYQDLEYKVFKKRVFFDPTIRKKLLVSAYGCYVPDVIRELIRRIIKGADGE